MDGTEALTRLITKESEDIEALEGRVAGARRRRDLLIAKALRAGISTRKLAPFARMSHVAVHLAGRRGEQDAATMVEQ